MPAPRKLDDNENFCNYGRLKIIHTWKWKFLFCYSKVVHVTHVVIRKSYLFSFILWKMLQGCHHPYKSVLLKIPELDPLTWLKRCCNSCNSHKMMLNVTYWYRGCQVSIWPPPRTIKKCPCVHRWSFFLPPVSLLQDDIVCVSSLSSCVDNREGVSVDYSGCSCIYNYVILTNRWCTENRPWLLGAKSCCLLEITIDTQG